MRVRTLPAVSPSSAPRRGPPIRGLVVALLLPLLTVAGSSLFAPGTALAVPPVAPSAGAVHSLVSGPNAPCTSSDPIVCSIREMAPE
ncbi:hypothetical protein ACFTXM_33835 [Streptomyces sp. NPDC056930]|uniref:hypothetical protein n=1 Tax=Streptomyces sp. NPDC056930 TaxID=3345967 RepID=UPI00362A6C54